MTVEYRDLIAEEIDRVLTPLHSNAMQRRDAMEFLPGRDLEMKNGTVIIRNTGGVVFDSDEGRAWLQANRPHLLPPEHSESEADAAFLSTNMTKRQALVQKVGLSEANRIAGQYGLRDIFERKVGEASGERSDKAKPAGNPWLDDSPRGEKRRIDFIKSCGARASASMAASAGRTIDGKPLRKTRAA